ncbi:MAG: hypothetical protein NWR72_21925 [Bacteroidia bacterium]|nr:hypothetical protein [Bacteroidia bacterium]
MRNKFSQKNTNEAKLIYGSVILALVMLPILAILLFHVTEVAETESSNCNVTYPGNSGNINLSVGDSLCIPSGQTFTGSVNGFPVGSKILVQSGAIFQPSNSNDAKGILWVESGGECFLTGSLGAGFRLENYGVSRIVNNLNINGQITIANRQDAELYITPTFTLGNNSSLINYGTMSAAQDFSTNSGTTFSNHGNLNTVKNLNLNGVVNNYGVLHAEDFININSNSHVANYCTLVSYDGFNNNSPLTENFGLVIITGGTGFPNDLFQNNSPFYNGPNAHVDGVRLINNSTISGAGTYYFSGQTKNQGSFGQDNQGIVFYDASYTGGIMDEMPQALHSSVVRAAVSHLDATYYYNTCDNSLTSQQPLPTEFFGISAEWKAGEAAISWETNSLADELAPYLIERATDAKAFRVIGQVSAAPGAGEVTYYEYQDSNVTLDPEAKVYYRVTQVGVDGTLRISPAVELLAKGEIPASLKSVSWNQNGLLIQMTGDFGTPLRIKILDMNGRTFATHELSASTASNSLIWQIPELPSATYVLVVEGTRSRARKVFVKK